MLGPTAVLYLVFFVYLGVYGFGNPDPDHAYFIDGVGKPALTREAALALATEQSVEVRRGYPVDMGHMFRSWFLWGFWASAFNIALIMTLVLLCHLCKARQGQIGCIGLVICAFTCCNTASWFLLGFFWRFSKAGRISAGERIERPEGTSSEINAFLQSQAEADGYQLKGGKFMSVFLWLVIGLLLGGGAILSIAFAISCMYGDDDSEDNKDKNKASSSSSAEQNKNDKKSSQKPDSDKAIEEQKNVENAAGDIEGQHQNENSELIK